MKKSYIMPLMFSYIMLVDKNMLEERSHKVQNKALKHLTEDRLYHIRPVVSGLTAVTRLTYRNHKTILEGSRKNARGQAEFEEKVETMSKF